MKQKILKNVAQSFKGSYIVWMLRSIAAGFLIGVGAIFSQWAAAQFENSLLSAFVFSFGLCFVFRFNAALFTGEAFKLTFVLLDANRSKLIDNLLVVTMSLLMVLAGNYVGSALISYLAAHSLPETVLQTICAKAVAISEMDMVTLAISAILCNVMVGLATLNNLKDGFTITSALVTMMCVTVFVALGWQHSIANITYTLTAFFYTGELPSTHILYTALFNFIGGAMLASTYYASFWIQK